MAQPPKVDHALGTSGDQDIVKGPPASDDAVFVSIATTDDLFEAELLAESLGEAGITVAARAQRDHLLDSLVSPVAAFWVLQVPRDEAERAKQIVAQTQADLRAAERSSEAAAESEELLSHGPAPSGTKGSLPSQ